MNTETVTTTEVKKPKLRRRQLNTTIRADLIAYMKQACLNRNIKMNDYLEILIEQEKEAV